MIDEKESIRHDEGAILQALREAGAEVFNSKKIRCPFHEDQSPSAGIYSDESGVWKFKCHAGGCGFGGDIFDIRERSTGRSAAEQIAELRKAMMPVQRTPAKPKTPPKHFATIDALKAAVPHVGACHIYTNPDTGSAELIVLRIEPPGDKKRFIQARPDGDGFVMQAPAGLRPLYNRARIRRAEKIVFVEGEKCVHALQAIGIVATTAPGGCGAKKDEIDFAPLAGKTVFIWPDNDPPNDEGISGGIEHMREVARQLEKLDPAPSLYWIAPESLELPPKGDAVDYLAIFGDRPNDQRVAVDVLLDEAEPIGAGAELAREIEDNISGKRSIVPFSFEITSRLTNALMPGTITVFCGDPGATKSMLVSQECAFWLDRGIKFAIYALEEDRNFHLFRALAQRTNNANITSIDWQKAHPDEIREALSSAFALMLPVSPREAGV